MHIQTQTGKLTRIVLLFSATSFCAILLCMGATGWHNVSASRAAGLQIYTYQNPFGSLNRQPVGVVSKAPGFLGKLSSAQFIVGVSSLGLLWLVSGLRLQARRLKKHAHRNIVPIANPEPKMNPLAILPPLPVYAQKEDILHKNVFGMTTTLCPARQRKAAVPCQSRFRPTSLNSRQKRPGRL